jgi:hypothetical protein
LLNSLLFVFTHSSSCAVILSHCCAQLNCTRSSTIYHSAVNALCTDFGPAFALTTCVFLLTGACMVPGICLGIQGYKRFDPMNRDTAYSRAPDGEEGHTMPDPSIPEGWD